MLPDEPLHALSLMPYRSASCRLGVPLCEGGDQSLLVGLAEPVRHPPLTGTERCGPDAVSRFAALSLRLVEVPYRTDRGVPQLAYLNLT
jgi:hypothetical protein